LKILKKKKHLEKKLDIMLYLKLKLMKLCEKLKNWLKRLEIEKLLTVMKVEYLDNLVNLQHLELPQLVPVVAVLQTSEIVWKILVWTWKALMK
jgi:hypothetical protein